MCSDFENLRTVIKDFGLTPQELSSEFMIRDNESLSQWRDRLYHTYRLPTILSALSDIKFSFVEQINPLLSRSIINTVRSIPDKMRTEKSLFKEIVNTLSPNIPYASKGANASPGEILKRKDFVDLLKYEINSHYARQKLPEEFLDFILKGIKEENISILTEKRLSGSCKDIIKAFLPRIVKNWLRDKGLSPKVDSNVLAFRVYMIIKMHKIIGEDISASII